MVHNEKVFLPIWLRYYRRFFKDIYIINHDTTDGSFDSLEEIHIMDVHLDSVHNNEFMAAVIHGGQEALLKEYDIVVYADVDELIIPDPLFWKDLSDYLDNFQGDVVACNSRSVVQQRHEPAIDFTKPLLSQRSVWIGEKLYNKPLISRIPTHWTTGQHSRSDGQGHHLETNIDPTLVLLHLSRLDFNIRKEKGEQIRKENWGAEEGQAIQWLKSGKELEKWFYDTPDIQEAPSDTLACNVCEYIPDRFKELV